MWVFLTCHSCHQNTGVLQESTSSQVGRIVPQDRIHIRRGNLTETDALYCDVHVALMPPFSLTGWLQVRLQQFRDQGHFLSPVSVGMLFRSVLGGLFFQSAPFQLPLVSVDLVSQWTEFGVSLHLLAGMSLLLLGHQFWLHGLAGSRDFALVVDSVPPEESSWWLLYAL